MPRGTRFRPRSARVRTFLAFWRDWPSFWDAYSVEQREFIDSGAYLTGFNDRLADSTYHWHDDATNFTQEADIRQSFDAIMEGQHDPQEMIDKMVEVIGAHHGKYRNVWPLSTEELIKQVQEAAWTLPVEPAVPAAAE